MKKIVLFLTFIIAVIGAVFAVIEVNSYYNKKKKIDDNTLIQETEDKIKEVEEKINAKQQEEAKVKEEKKDKIEEMETWEKKTKDMEENL